MARTVERAIAQEARFINIDDKPVQAKVVREGFQVPSVALDIQQADFLLENLVTVAPRFSPRVVSQSIPAGTKVTSGTVVNLILAPKDSIPFGIFEGTHADLKGRTLNHVDDLVENAKTRELLLKRETASAVLPAEKDFLITELGKKGITVNESDPERTFEKAFGNVRSAVAFR
jgi:hypothetical protein